MRRKCPLSGILFVIAVEILANSITNDQSIEGTNIKGREYKVSHYVEDPSCFANVNSIQKSCFRNHNFSKIARDWNALMRADFTDQISALNCVIQPPL